MSLVRLAAAARYYGAELIFGPVDLEIQAGARIGLVGPNGSGKSSLLRMVAGDAPDEGSVVVARGARIELLRQELPHFPGTLFEFVRSSLSYLDEIEARLRALEAKMGDPEVQADPERLAEVMAAYSRETARFEREGGYERDARARGALFGLGFTAEELDRPFDTLSGGQRSRAELARVLLAGADLMLLDEPTNHLDLESTEWLQNFLQRGRGGYVVVSHDRVLLDQVTEETWEIEGTDVIVYPGNYAASRQLAAARRERMAKVYAEDQKERERLEAFIRKYKAGNRSTQAKSREKRLARMEDVPPPPKELPKAKFSVPSGPRSERQVCVFEDVSLRYGDRTIFSNLSLLIERGSRIGIAGPNGSGKSTILKAIGGELPPAEGHVQLGRGVVLRYFAQHRDDLDPRKTVLDEALDEKRQTSGEARSFLARFLFRGDDVYKQVAVLSGGEKSRLALAKLLLRGGNFLLLDEPTNHLDIGMREALEEALDEYDGTLLVVTHDRALLERVAKVVWWVENGEVKVFEAGYRALAAWLAERRAASGEAAPVSASGSLSGVSGSGSRSAASGPGSQSAVSGSGSRSGVPGAGSRSALTGSGPAAPVSGPGSPSAVSASGASAPVAVSAAAVAGSPHAAPEGPKDARAERRKAASRKKALERLAAIERDLERLAERKASVEAALSDPATYGDLGKVDQLSKEHAEVLAEIERLEDEWSNLAEAIEHV